MLAQGTRVRILRGWYKGSKGTVRYSSPRMMSLEGRRSPVVCVMNHVEIDYDPMGLGAMSYMDDELEVLS